MTMPNPDTPTATEPDVWDLLTDRLMNKHGVKPMAARSAVARFRKGFGGRHVDLVRQEAALMTAEAMDRVTLQVREILRTAYTEMQRRLGPIVAQIRKAQKILTKPPGTPVKGHQVPKGWAFSDRPAWKSPHGPAHQKRRTR